MNEFNLIIGKIVGSPDSNSWTQVLSFDPAEEEQKETRGHLLAVLSLTCDGDVEPASYGREVLTVLEKEYFSSISGGGLAALEKAVGEACSVLSNLSTQKAGVGVKFNLTTGAVCGNVLYLAQKGSGRAQIVRGGILKTILEPIDEQKIQTASGFLKPGDLTILSSSAFEKIYSEADVLANLNHDVANLIDALAPKISDNENSALSGAIFAQIQGEGTPLRPAEPDYAGQAEGAEETRLRQDFGGQTEETGGVTESAEIAGNAEDAKNAEITGNAGGSGSLGSRISAVGMRLGMIWPWKNKGIYLKTGEKRFERKHVLIVVVVILIGILGFSVAGGIIRRGDSQKETQFQSLYTQAQDKYNEAALLADFNPVRARTIYGDSQKLLEQASALKIHTDEVKALTEKINQGLAAVSGVKKVDNLSVFFDLTLIKAGATGASFILDGKTLYILDNKNGTVYKLQTGSKASSVLASDGGLIGAMNMTLSGGKLYVLGKDKDVLSVDTGSGKTSEAITADNDYGQVVTLDNFGSNLYLLDKDKSQVWKMVPTRGGFEKQEYLTQETDLGKALDLTIDGSIWILSEGDRVFKFTRGKKEEFSLKNVENVTGSLIKITTGEESEKLYFLNKQAGQVAVVSKKDGDYLTAYQSGVIAQTNNLVVDEESKKIYLLGDAKIYVLEIQ